MARLPRIVNGFPEHKRWCDCLDCRASLEDWHEAQHALRLLARDQEVRQAKPATEQEWAAFMSGEFPREQTGATS